MALRGINKVILIGRLGQDPDVRQLQDGSAVANLSLATSESWRDKATGEDREKAEWHRVAVFGKLAEVADKYLRKGSQVYIEGKLQTRKWQDQNGQDRYTTEIVVQGYNGAMQILGNRTVDNQGMNSNGQPTQSNLQKANNQYQADNHGYPPSREPNNSGQQYNEPPADFDDDIPF